MGTDELTPMQELARRVILLEKLVLRQQSRMDELIRRIESLESGEVCAKFTAQKPAFAPPVSEDADTGVFSSVSDLLDEELKRDLARAYGTEPPPEKTAESVQDSLTNAMARAAGSYARATGGKEPVQSESRTKPYGKRPPMPPRSRRHRRANCMKKHPQSARRTTSPATTHSTTCRELCSKRKKRRTTSSNNMKCRA